MDKVEKTRDRISVSEGAGTQTGEMEGEMGRRKEQVQGKILKTIYVEILFTSKVHILHRLSR